MAARRQPPEPAPEVAQAPIVFALAPGGDANQLLDLNNPSGAKFYSKAIAPLEHKFDLNPDSLTTFLSTLEHRALTTGWNFNVPGENGVMISLTRNYGQLHIIQVRAHVDTYSNTQSRQAQNSRQLFLCIMSTLTEEAKAHMILFMNAYMSHGHFSGMLLLKLVILESYVDTNATTRLLRERLSSLDKMMVTLKSDINKFNSYVKVQTDALAARGERTEDLIANLFKGYAMASDRSFRQYIAKKEDEYDDGTAMLPTELMHLALNKYKSMMEKGKWNEKSEEETKIIALQAKLDATIGKNKSNIKPSIKVSPKPVKKLRKERPAWMMVKPEENEEKKKTVNGKEYWWCNNHAMWCRHSTNQCEYKGINGNAKPKAKPKANDKRTGHKNQDQVKLARAITTVIEINDSSDEE